MRGYVHLSINLVLHNKYYLTTNIYNFLQTQNGFYYADSLWLVIEGPFTKNSSRKLKASNVTATSWCMVQGDQSFVKYFK